MRLLFKISEIKDFNLVFVIFNFFCDMYYQMKLNNIVKKIYYKFLSKFIDGKIKIFNRHSSYKDYVKKQIEKTLDPKRISRWKGVEWQTKVDGFDQAPAFCSELSLLAANVQQ